MLVIPTIYLRNHRVANPAPEARFHLPEDPLVLADEMQQAGVTTMHIVDLDAPQTIGHVTHGDLLKQFTEGGRFTVQVAGPLRTVEAVDRYLQLGVARIVLGSIAYQKPAFTAEVGKRFPHRIAVEISVRHNRVAIPGWTVAAHKSALDYGRQFADAGVSCVCYSDVGEGGELTAENMTNIREFASHIRMPVIHATDLTTIEELEQMLLLEKFGVIGTLLSKSLYEGRFDLKGIVTMAMERGLPAEESTLIPE
ncbi:MAG: hypothetical protein HYV03_05600 [Deltaproteobacteria bacterium]|nr:hypothetical protein [Deltaproteobacteria bacterium]